MDQKGDHMARVTRAASHLSAEEVKRRLKYDPRPWCRGRWLIIYNATLRAQESGGGRQALWRVKGHGPSSDLHLQSLGGLVIPTRKVRTGDEYG